MKKIEHLIEQIKNTQKTQRIYDSKDEPVYFNLVKENLNNKELKDKYGIEILLFEETSDYNAFIKIFFKKDLLEDIISLMKNTNQNPMSFDAWNNKDYFNFLKSAPRKIVKEKYDIKIDIVDSSGYGMGENPSEAIVSLLVKI